MALRKVFSGQYECPQCGQQFDAKGVPEDDLVCTECDEISLVEVEEGDDQDEDGEEDA